MIIKLILIVLAILAFVAWFIKKAKQVRETKARVRLAHMKWLLEKADECDLKDEGADDLSNRRCRCVMYPVDDDDSTKTLPILPVEP